MLIWLTQETINGKTKVGLQHFQPEELTDADKVGGIEVDSASIPAQPTPIIGKAYVLCYDNGVFSWESVSVPLTLEQRLKATEDALAVLMGL